MEITGGPRWTGYSGLLIRWSLVRIQYALPLPRSCAARTSPLTTAAASAPTSIGYVERAMRKALALILLGYLGAAAAQGNPAARPTRDITALAGTWNGAHLEQRRSCRST